MGEEVEDKKREETSGLIKLLVCLLFAIACEGCGSSHQFLPQGRDAHILADRMLEIKQKYDLPLGRHGVKVKFTAGRPPVKESGGIELATCKVKFTKFGAAIEWTISVNRQVFNARSQESIDYILLHEMGHCLYNLTHYPDGVMATTTDGKDVIEPNDVARFVQRVKSRN